MVEAVAEARWRPRITHEPAPVDLDAAERAAADMLAALGLPVDSEDMVETPRRLVQAYAEMLDAPEFDSRRSATAPGTTSWSWSATSRSVAVRAPPAPVHRRRPRRLSPGERILGLSKFARTVEFFARRAQTQERLTSEVADHLVDRLAAATGSAS